MVSWNCALLPVTVFPLYPLEPMCTKGIVAYDLMIPVCVLQVVAVCMIGWVYRREARDAKAAAWAEAQVAE